VAGRTQAALYRSIELELSWSEEALPQVERTKHVHALHPYLGKFIPQLVEVFLRRCFQPGECVYDPFSGSGTTLVEANAYGCDAVGCDISAFNCLLARVKTGAHRLAELELALRGVLQTPQHDGKPPHDRAGEWARRWYAPRALAELLAYRALAEQLVPQHQDVARLVLSRAARSARLTTHFDLDFPRVPVRAPYWCHKHKRTCRPVEQAAKFLCRYTDDTLRRLRAYAALRTPRRVEVIHGDARTAELPLRPSGIITSPPYPGLIDYHEQHRYAFELLGLPDRRPEEIGPAARGRARSALAEYGDAMVAAFRNARGFLPRRAPVVIVVNDSLGLYPTILERSGLALEERLTRHVNRRTGRRAGEFFEEVLVCRTA
jgi:DNA methylase